MAVMIVKETGSGDDPTANSYASLDDLRTYAELRGETLPDADDEAAVLLIKAMDYLRQYDDQWIGSGKTDPDQPLAWPRADVWRDDAYKPNDWMPRELEQAQCALAVEAQTGDLLPTRLPTDQGPVTEERVEGAVTVQYANPGHVLQVAAYAKADTLLKTLLKRKGLFAVRA